MIRRVNFYGGPGVGKSVLAARVFGELSVLKGEGNRPRYRVEHVTEYVKDWAYLGRKPVSFDQVYLFAKQMNREDLRLQFVPQIITDCPLLVPAAYAREYGFAGWRQIADLAVLFEESYPSLNIILDREGIEYESLGRYQTFDEAVKIDRMVSDMVYQFAPPSSIHVMPAVDFKGIVALVEKVVQQSAGGN